MPSGRSEWIAMAKAIYSRFGEVQVTDRAAALTYYSILSLFPALIVVVSLLALLGQYPQTYESIVNTLHHAAPGTAVNTIDTALRDALSNRGNAGVLPDRRPRARPLLGLGGDGRGDARSRGDQPCQGRERLPPESGRAPGADRALHPAGARRLPGGGGRRAPLG